MAIFNVKVSGRKSYKTTNSISSTLLELNMRYLKGRKDFTVVVVDYLDRDTWVTGGVPLAEQSKSCLIMNVTVSDAVTDEDKAMFIKETFAAFNQLLGDLHEDCYISIQQFNQNSFSYNRPFK
jgi:4-oxalocrotonate tautomerase